MNLERMIEMAELYMHDLGLTYDYNRLETRDTTDTFVMEWRNLVRLDAVQDFARWLSESRSKASL